MTKNSIDTSTRGISGSEGMKTGAKKASVLPDLESQENVRDIRGPILPNEPWHVLGRRGLYSARWFIVALGVYLLLRNPDLIGVVPPVSTDLVSY